MARSPRRATKPPVDRLLERVAAGYTRPIHLDRKPGVYAFAQPMESERRWHPKIPRWSSTDRLTGASLRTCKVTVGGKPYKLIQYCGGRTEVYRVEPSSLETFLGYADDVLAMVLTGAYSTLCGACRSELRQGRKPEGHGGCAKKVA
jgi:hypothetical protein